MARVVDAVTALAEQARSAKWLEHPALQPPRRLALAAAPVVRRYADKYVDERFVASATTFASEHPVAMTYVCILGLISAFPIACFVGFVAATIFGALIAFIVVESALVLSAFVGLLFAVAGCVFVAAGATAFAVTAYYVASVGLRVARELFGVDLLLPSFADLHQRLMKELSNGESQPAVDSIASLSIDKQEGQAVQDLAASATADGSQ